MKEIVISLVAQMVKNPPAREVGGGIRMGNTCKPMAVSFQCMTKSTTNKKKKKKKKNPPAMRETWV